MSAAPPSTTSKTTSTPTWRAFMSAPRQRRRPRAPAAQHGDRQSGERDEQRHERDIGDLGPEHQAFRVAAQCLAHFLQLALGLGGARPGALDLALLLGAEDLRGLRRAARLLQLLQLLARLLQLALERLDLAQ